MTPTATPNMKLLIADDDRASRMILTSVIAEWGYEVAAEAENGLSALAQMRRVRPDLVLLDVMMPQMDGHAVLDHMKSDPSLRDIPVVMISSLDEVEGVARCLERGADDYLVKPFNPTLLRARVTACLEKKRLHDTEDAYRAQIEDYNLNLEDRVREQVREITSAQRATIFAMAKLAESRDPDTGEHLERMREYCLVLGRHLQTQPKFETVVDDAFVENLAAASPLHDIGKVGIPDQMLQKPGPLTTSEFEVMKGHTTIGAEALREVDRQHPGNAFVEVGIDLAQSHHERWNGQGYPQGLAGEAIPLVARILALGDVFDALSSRRCYKEPLPPDEIRRTLVDGHGEHFDPDVVDAFVACEAEFADIRARFEDASPP